MHSYLKTIIETNGKIKFTIVCTDGHKQNIPVEIRAKIDSYNRDIFWKPGVTRRPLYNGKSIYQLTCARFAFYLKLGRIWSIPESEHLQTVCVRWNIYYRGQRRYIIPMDTIGSYIENHDKGMVKIVNTDVQIYERIIKVTRHRPPFHHVNKCLRLLCSRLYSSSTHVEHRWQESSHGLVRRSEHGIRTSRLTRSCSECSSANSSFSCTSPCSLDSHSSSVRRNCRRMSCCSAGSVSPTLRFEISYWMQSPEWKVATVVPRQGIAIC